MLDGINVPYIEDVTAKAARQTIDEKILNKHGIVYIPPGAVNISFWDQKDGYDKIYTLLSAFHEISIASVLGIAVSGLTRSIVGANITMFGRGGATQKRRRYKRMTRKRMTRKRLPRKRMTRKRMTRKRITGKRITGKRMTRKRMTHKRMTHKRITGKRMTHKRITGKRMTGKRMTGKHPRHRNQKAQRK